MRFQPGTFLFCCLALLLATGIWQRVANPSLEYHLQHAPASLPEKPIASSAPAPGDAPIPLTPEDAATLGQAMKAMREQPNNPEVYRKIADIFIRYKDWKNAAKFLERAAALTPQKTP